MPPSPPWGDGNPPEDMPPPGFPGEMPPGMAGKMPPGMAGKMPPGMAGKMPPGMAGKMPPGMAGKMPPGMPDFGPGVEVKPAGGAHPMYKGEL